MNEARNILVIAGPSDAGKSTTVRIIAQKLRQYADDPNDPSVPYPKTDYQNSTSKIAREREILTRIKINGQYVGLASMGDNVRYIKEKTFSKLETEWHCDYIVCCCREKGSTRTYIEDSYSNRVYKWYPLPKMSTFNEIKEKEFEIANTIVQDLIIQLFPIRKYIICDTNEPNKGKSDSLLKIFEYMEHRYSKYRTFLDTDFICVGDKDVYAEYDINGIKIAILTLGDDVKQYHEHLDRAATTFCADLILCASQKDYRNKTNDHISCISSNYGYRVVWGRNPYVDTHLLPIELNLFPDAFAHEVDILMHGLYGLFLI